MTPVDLLDGLAQLLGETLKDVTGKTGKPFTVYQQYLPPDQRPLNPKAAEDAQFQRPVKKYPYCLIELQDGSQGEEESEQEVVLLVASKDEAEDMQGFRDVGNAIERIRQSLIDHQMIGACRLKLPINWTYSAESKAHPYYLGAMQLTYSIPNSVPSVSPYL